MDFDTGKASDEERIHSPLHHLRAIRSTPLPKRESPFWKNVPTHPRLVFLSDWILDENPALSREELPAPADYFIFKKNRGITRREASRRLGTIGSLGGGFLIVLFILIYFMRMIGTPTGVFSGFMQLFFIIGVIVFLRIIGSFEKNRAFFYLPRYPIELLNFRYNPELQVIPLSPRDLFFTILCYESRKKFLGKTGRKGMIRYWLGIYLIMSITYVVFFHLERANQWEIPWSIITGVLMAILLLSVILSLTFGGSDLGSTLAHSGWSSRNYKAVPPVEYDFMQRLKLRWRHFITSFLRDIDELSRFLAIIYHLMPILLIVFIFIVQFIFLIVIKPPFPWIPISVLFLLFLLARPLRHRAQRYTHWRFRYRISNFEQWWARDRHFVIERNDEAASN